MVVWGVGITSVGVDVVVDNKIGWVVLEFNLLVIVSVAVGELVGVLHSLDEQVHVVHVEWVVAQLNESNLSSSVSGSAEAEVLKFGPLDQQRPRSPYRRPCHRRKGSPMACRSPWI